MILRLAAAVIPADHTVKFRRIFVAVYNHAERLVRHAVLWRKSSFGTDSETGTRFVERILTVVATLRLQKRNVLDYVTDACRASLHHQSPPSLLATPLYSLHLSQAA